MVKEYTVEDRANIIKSRMKDKPIMDIHRQQLEEVLYTLSENGDIEEMSVEEAILIFKAVELVLFNEYTKEMRL